MAPRTGNPYDDLKKNSAAAAEANDFGPHDLAKLQNSLLGQITRNGLTPPQGFYADAVQPGFFGWMDRASKKANNLLADLFHIPHADSDGYMDGRDIVGISPDGDVRKSLKKGIYASGCDNYLDDHFDEFQRMVALHETAHYVDRQLGLTKGIEARIARNATKADPGLTERSHGTSLLESNLAERIADASSVIYALSNYGDGPLYKKIMDWRDANREKTHYAASTTAAAIDAFEKNPRKGMNIIETTKMAARTVEQQAGLVIREEHALGSIPSAKEEPGLTPSHSNDALQNQIIARSQIGRDDLCERPMTKTHAAPAPH